MSKKSIIAIIIAVVLSVFAIPTVYYGEQIVEENVTSLTNPKYEVEDLTNTYEEETTVVESSETEETILDESIAEIIEEIAAVEEVEDPIESFTEESHDDYVVSEDYICSTFDEDGYCTECGLPGPDVPEETYCSHQNVYKNISDDGKIDFICHDCGMDGLYEFYDEIDEDYEKQAGIIAEEETEHFCEIFEDGYCVDCGMEDPWVYANEDEEPECQHEHVERVVSDDGNIDFICDDCDMDGLYEYYNGHDEEYEKQAGLLIDKTEN